MSEKEKNLKKSYKELATSIIYLSCKFDEIMKAPESRSRGKKLAQLMNWIDMKAQGALHFDFDLSFRQIDNIYKKLGKANLDNPKDRGER
jgi:hypothetical protein